jgi:hypothetical protein
MKSVVAVIIGVAGIVTEGIKISVKDTRKAFSGFRTYDSYSMKLETRVVGCTSGPREVPLKRKPAIKR